MGIRNAPRSAAMVQRKKSVKGSAGQHEWIDDGDPVKVPGNLHPASTDETVAYGLQANELARFHCLTWPGDLHSTASIDGVLWEVAAPAQHYTMSPSTAHWEVLLRRRA